MKKEDLKAVIDIKGLNFTYPGAPEPTLKRTILLFIRIKSLQ